MKTIRIGFSSSWDRIDPSRGQDSSIVALLQRYYDVRIVPPREADYLFFSVFNGDHHAEAREDAIKILLTGESYCPDFNACDYAISFEYLSYGDRHLRYPLYLLYPDADRLGSLPALSLEALRAKPHFCNFIYSNGGAEPVRDALFHALNQRKPVLSAGRHLNNTLSADARFPGLEPNAAKRRFMADCRFSLAVENSAHPGYVTEKIADAFLARTVPVYWGDPLVAQEFNPASFVNVRDFASHAELADFVMELDRNEERTLAMLNTPPLRQPDQFASYGVALTAFLRNIFDQDQTSARRRPRGGFAGTLERRRRRDGAGLRALFKRNRV